MKLGAWLVAAAALTFTDVSAQFIREEFSQSVTRERDLEMYIM